MSSVQSPKTPLKIQSSVGKSKGKSKSITKTKMQTSVSHLSRSPISQNQIEQALARDRQRRRGIYVDEHKGIVNVKPVSYDLMGLSPKSMERASKLIHEGVASPQTPDYKNPNSQNKGGSKKKVDYGLINSILKSFGADCKCNDNIRKGNRKKRQNNKRSNRKK